MLLILLLLLIIIIIIIIATIIIIIIINSHRSAAKTKTVGWVKTNLNNAKIDTNKFTAPSASAVSSSKGELSELSLSEMLRRSN